MEKIAVTGLVLRESPVGDNDKLLTLLTAEHGKMIVSGKGVKSLRNKNMASCQQFAYSSFILSKNKGGYYYVSETELHESFYSLRDDLDKLALACYVCDVADDCSVEENVDVALLRLTLNTLYAIANVNKPQEQIKGAFELRCASVCGFMPDMTGCAMCGDDGAEMYYLDVLNGELICPDCMGRRDYEKEDAMINSEWRRPFIVLSRSLLQAFIYTVAVDISKLISFTLDGEELHQYEKACETYLLHHLGHGFKTLDYYHQYRMLAKN